MALWKETPATKPTSTFPAPEPTPAARFDVPVEPAAVAPVVAPRPAPARETARAESLIAPDIAIEGKIEGSGHVRIAGKFKGDVDVRGDLTIEPGAKVTGSVRADKVTIAGELVGNIEAASRVDLLQSGTLTGDLKAGTLTVAAGSRMRGTADFGWDDGKGDGGKSESGKNGAT